MVSRLRVDMIREPERLPNKEVDQKAREARSAIHGPEGESLRRAEDLGKERIKR